MRVLVVGDEPLSQAAELIDAVPHLEKLTLIVQARVAVKAKGKFVFLNPANLSAVIAQGNYVLLQHEPRSYLLREKISLITQQLKPYGFIRIHRSVLVNRAFVEELKPQLTGEYTLRIKGGKEYTVSRTYKQNLGLLADSWIGSDVFLCDEIAADHLPPDASEHEDYKAADCLEQSPRTRLDDQPITT